jgi:hypothetical protein
MQGAVCFLGWIGYGAWFRSRSGALKERMHGTSRGRRVVLGSLGIIGSAILLLAGMLGLQALGGLREGGLTLWAWPLVFLLGLGFVHMQVMGAAAIITLVQDEETSPRARASESAQGKENAG